MEPLSCISFRKKVFINPRTLTRWTSITSSGTEELDDARPAEERDPEAEIGRIVASWGRRWRWRWRRGRGRGRGRWWWWRRRRRRWSCCPKAKVASKTSVVILEVLPGTGAPPCRSSVVHDPTNIGAGLASSGKPWIVGRTIEVVPHGNVVSNFMGHNLESKLVNWVWAIAWRIILDNWHRQSWRQWRSTRWHCIFWMSVSSRQRPTKRFQQRLQHCPGSRARCLGWHHSRTWSKPSSCREQRWTMSMALTLSEKWIGLTVLSDWPVESQRDCTSSAWESTEWWTRIPGIPSEGNDFGRSSWRW